MNLSSPQDPVLVTGGAGYIGSHVVLRLLQDHPVVVVDNLSRGHRELIPKAAAFQHLDLRDRQGLMQLFHAHRFRAVVHLAGLAYVGESMLQPAIYFEHNVVAAQNLLDGMVAGSVTRLVLSSTCAVYGVPPSVPLTEAHPLAPINAYGESKAMIERFLPWYDRAYGLHSIALRYFNAAGADPEGRSGEWHDPEPHLIPNLLSAAASDTPFAVYGTDYPTSDGSCIRDYVHVADLADAHAAAVSHLLNGGHSLALNLGTGTGTSVLQAVHYAESVLGRRIAIARHARRPGDPPTLVAHADKAKKILGWQPRHSRFDEILETAWTWHLRRQPELAKRAASSSG